MEEFQNSNDLLGDTSNNNSFIRRYNYEIQHSSFYITSKLSSFCEEDIITNIKKSGVDFQVSKFTSICISSIIKTNLSDISSLVKQYENIQKLNDENKTIKIKLQQKEEEIIKLKNLSSKSFIFMSTIINSFKNSKDQNELQKAYNSFLEEMNKRNKRISTINKKMKEKEKEKSNIDLREDNSKEKKNAEIQEKELKEEIKIKFKKISEEDKTKIENFRKEFNLNEKDHSNEDLFNALYRNKFNFSTAFESLFSN